MSKLKFLLRIIDLLLVIQWLIVMNKSLYAIRILEIINADTTGMLIFVGVFTLATGIFLWYSNYFTKTFIDINKENKYIDNSMYPQYIYSD